MPVAPGNASLAAHRKAVDGPAHDLLGDLQGTAFLELDVRGPGDLGFGACGDQLCMVPFGNGHQALHDALHVDDHRLDGAGEDGQLLLEHVAGRGNAFAHNDLVGRAAEAR